MKAKFLRALFHDKQPTTRSEIGRNIFLQFETVVFLTQQKRMNDPDWSQLLNRARVSECMKNDLEILRSLVLGNAKCEVPDFNTAPWKNAVLITPRNSVRVRWNELALKKHCHLTGNIQYSSLSENSTKDGALTMLQKLTVAQMPVDETGELESTVNIAIGAPIMITENICPAINLANGTRGIITDIILDPREAKDSRGSMDTSLPIQLTFPPLYIIIETAQSSPTNLVFDGLPPKQIPVFPITRHFFIGAKPRIQVT